ncbi:MAG: hypothetical protein EZS28_006750 [Streblomastix strix]|uniref:RRM domain-containing protein n=1 Tax=Streblomastix strix TaxID=222440 RepID=A0A5J4WS31_9EUKA|nr:MAG: hypothetical protein EZS28_006750 [Streblomastix strix]
MSNINEVAKNNVHDIPEQEKSQAEEKRKSKEFQHGEDAERINDNGDQQYEKEPDLDEEERNVKLKGRLDWLEEQEVIRVFSVYGEVDQYVVKTAPNSNESGFGFIYYKRRESVDRLLEATDRVKIRDGLYVMVERGERNKNVGITPIYTNVPKEKIDELVGFPELAKEVEYPWDGDGRTVYVEYKTRRVAERQKNSLNYLKFEGQILRTTYADAAFLHNSVFVQFDGKFANEMRDKGLFNEHKLQEEIEKVGKCKVVRVDLKLDAMQRYMSSGIVVFSPNNRGEMAALRARGGTEGESNLINVGGVPVSVTARRDDTKRMSKKNRSRNWFWQGQFDQFQIDAEMKVLPLEKRAIIERSDININQSQMKQQDTSQQQSQSSSSLQSSSQSSSSLQNVFQPYASQMAAQNTSNINGVEVVKIQSDSRTPLFEYKSSSGHSILTGQGIKVHNPESNRVAMWDSTNLPPLRADLLNQGISVKPGLLPDPYPRISQKLELDSNLDIDLESTFEQNSNQRLQ